MRKIRTPEHICLLCKNNKANKKGSHYTPAGIIKRVIGERNYEELYTINPHNITTTKYYGRSNLLNTNPTIKKPEHVDDYIFCTSCEKKLGIIESECNNPLVRFTDQLIQGNLIINRTKQGKKFFSFKHPNKNVLTLYFFSIIWRQCLQQKEEFNTIFISEKFQEDLREIIDKEISKSIKEIENSTDFATYPSLIILTTYHKGDNSKNFINPNPSPTSPELFFIGPYDALIFHSQHSSLGFESKTRIPASMIDSDLIINFSQESIIGILSESAWTKVNNQLVKYVSNKFLHNITVKLSVATRMPYSYSRQKLHTVAHQFLAQYPDDYIRCLHLAFSSLSK